MSDRPPRWTDQQILESRPPKHPADPGRPYGFLVEPELAATGRVEEVATIFLTNQECPYRCLMCDLWRHTTDERLPPGAIPEQIDFALGRLPPARHVKLYNSGNFFDHQAIPYVELTEWDPERLYVLKADIVRRGIEATTGVTMPSFEKRRFQHGVVDDTRFDSVFPATETAYRTAFLSLYE